MRWLPILLLITGSAKAQTHVDFKGNKVVVEKNGVVVEVEIDKKLLTEGDSDAIVDLVNSKLKQLDLRKEK